ncbi:Oxidoreductase-like, N-terminal [Dillenia turbinata]|uniref:Oxidoreductase-like, N-terminal n=1 Tax=Dillenia turbinata TaxID=194707 RepID=A0AAN8UVH6_9MAGN
MEAQNYLPRRIRFSDIPPFPHRHQNPQNLKQNKQNRRNDNVIRFRLVMRDLSSFRFTNSIFTRTPQQLSLSLPNLQLRAPPSAAAMSGVAPTNISQSNEEEEPKGLPEKSPPPLPEKPMPGDCCGSGCVRCVWDIYYEELDAYNNYYKSKDKNSESESKSSS